MKLASKFARRLRKNSLPILLSYPKIVQCNVCGWGGWRFASDSWHKHVICPSCQSDIRQRLFFTALQNTDQLSFDKIINNRLVLHFAPENISAHKISNKAARYVTADFLRSDCDLRLNMSCMPQIENSSFDVVIAFDVLEHVPDYRDALKEVHRVLSSDGFAIFTVPQKDDLLVTYEDSNITTREERNAHFGQWDHLRIFGDDFPHNVQIHGFNVHIISKSIFHEELVRKHVLYPPILSKHPLATNHRKVFFCQKST